MKSDYLNSYLVAFNSQLKTMEEVIDFRLNFLEEAESTVKNVKITTRGSIRDLCHDLQALNEKWIKLDTKKEDEVLESLDLEFTRYQSFALSPNPDIPRIVKDIQSEARFTSNPGDVLIVRFLKFFKRGRYKAHKFFARIGLLGKRRKKEGIKWNHAIAIQDLHSYVFGVHSISFITEMLSDVVRKGIVAKEVTFEFYENFFRETLSVISESLKAGSLEELDFGDRFQFISDKIIEERSQLVSYKEGLRSKIDTHFREQYKLLESLYEKAGTLELTNSTFRKSRNQRSGRKVYARYARDFTRWKNTHHALSDDWALSEEVFGMNLRSVVRSEELVSINQNRIEEDILSKSADINSYLSDVKERILKINESKDLAVEIKKQVYQSRKKLDNDLVSDLIDSILNQNFPHLVQGIETTITEYIDELSTERAITSSDYSDPISPDKVSRIDPREIVQYSVLPVLKKDIEDFSREVKKIQTDIIRKVSNIGQTLKFGLEAGLDQLENSDDEFSVVQKNIDEAIERTISRTNEFQALVNELASTFKGKSNELMADLISGTSFLTINQNVIDLRIKLVRAKAIERSKSWRRGIRNNIIRGFRKTLHAFKNGYNFLLRKLFQVQELTGISSGSAEASSQTSTFLIQAWQSVNSLPYFYQKLFSLDALTDTTLFYGRQNELKQLEDAYESWESGSSLSIAVVGERGGGKTSLVNYFIQKKKVSIPFKTYTIPSLICDSDEAIRFLAGELGFKNIKSTQDLADRINELPSKQVVLLRHVEKLFVRKIGGFEAIKEFVDLMIKTNQKILWIITVHKSAWHYLSASIGIDDFVTRKIALEEFTDHDLRASIEARNQISGYNVVYNPTEEDKQNKNFQKLDGQEAQDYLAQKYFSQLRRFSRSNVSLALIVWMIAAHEKDEETIEITGLERQDFSFVSKLSKVKVFILHLLLLHGKVKLEDMQPALNLDLESIATASNSMHQAGILQKIDEEYCINPLIYRAVTQMLKEKNLVD